MAKNTMATMDVVEALDRAAFMLDAISNSTQNYTAVARAKALAYAPSAIHQALRVLRKLGVEPEWAPRSDLGSCDC